MIQLTRTELLGIFGSIAVMALALAVMRFDSLNTLASAVPEGSSQTGIVVVGDDEGALRNALIESSTSGSLSKLIVDDVVIGVGREVAVDDTVVVNYIGSTQDGIQFDNSYTRGEPFTFTVGKGKVIAGWEQGIIGMKVGGQRVLVVPPSMAYGNKAVGPIPANSNLVFTIELLEIE